MEENPEKAPGKYKARRTSLCDRAGNDAAFFLFAAIAFIFGVNGAFTGLVCLGAMVVGIAGADIGTTDVTPFGLAVMTAIPTVPCLGIAAIAWRIARAFHEE